MALKNFCLAIIISVAIVIPLSLQQESSPDEWVVDESDMQSERIRNCCRDQNLRPECMPICKENASASLLAQSVANGCYDALHILIYCASEGHDNTKCCNDSNTPDNCLIFCQGQAPPLCKRGSFSLMNLLPCLGYLDIISTCYHANLTAEPAWVKGYEFPPPPPCD